MYLNIDRSILGSIKLACKLQKLVKFACNPQKLTKLACNPQKLTKLTCKLQNLVKSACNPQKLTKLVCNPKKLIKSVWIFQTDDPRVDNSIRDQYQLHSSPAKMSDTVQNTPTRNKSFQSTRVQNTQTQNAQPQKTQTQNTQTRNKSPKNHPVQNSLPQNTPVSISCPVAHIATKKQYPLAGNSVAFVARHARSLFRSEVWHRVGSLLANEAGPNADNYDSFTALQYTNHNSTSVVADGCPSLVSVVMLEINPGIPPKPHTKWSAEAIDTTIQRCAKYGEIDKDTHIIVQLFFKGLMNKKGAGACWPVDEAVGVILMSAKGMLYTYNVPGGVPEQLAFRVVSRLLSITTGNLPCGAFRIINYRPRTSSDDNLYAIFLTSSTTTESRKQALKDAGTDIEVEAADLSTCRPSTRCCRPTRVIGNLRFLMLLCKPFCEDVESDLLLDETNTLDTFRRLTLPWGDRLDRNMRRNA
ncbi:hypothetical protein T484DRAFT_1757698 [Baffinella frigidus]|nr:hypothetical protein T484DRAFT_1757698 [Cryptophyta sp. CCMP2293]